MDERQELMQLVENMEQEKLATALRVMKQLAGDDAVAGKEKGAEVEALQELLTSMVYSLSNTLYDLSIDADRKGEKVMAKRLEAYRKKVAENWDRYKSANAGEK